jgi:hypothetical protein
VDRIKIYGIVLIGVIVAVFSVIIFMNPARDMIGVAANSSSVQSGIYPKLESLIKFSPLVLFVGAFIVIIYMAWKRRNTG